MEIRSLRFIPQRPHYLALARQPEISSSLAPQLFPPVFTMNCAQRENDPLKWDAFRYFSWNRSSDSLRFSPITSPALQASGTQLQNPRLPGSTCKDGRVYNSPINHLVLLDPWAAGVGYRPAESPCE